jgi:uncharacterized protein with HEPN domain
VSDTCECPNVSITTRGLTPCAMRSGMLTHAYGAIDHRTVWGVLERRVPLLRSEVEPLLQSLQTD